MKFYVGAGHSDKDPGAVAGKLTEAQLAEEVRNLIAMELRKNGHTVITDGDGDTNKSLNDSIKLAQTADKGSRIEIHFNAGPSSAKGIECLSKPDQKGLSQRIAQAISGVTGSPLRGDKGWKDQGDGQHKSLGFCNTGDGIVVEVEFISNPTALAVYQAKKQAVAVAIAGTLLEV